MSKRFQENYGQMIYLATQNPSSNFFILIKWLLLYYKRLVKIISRPLSYFSFLMSFSVKAQRLSMRQSLSSFGSNLQAVQEAPLDVQETEKLRQKTAFILEKDKEYSRMIDRQKSILEQRSGFRPEISLETLLAIKAELDRIRADELAPLKASLDAYKVGLRLL